MWKITCPGVILSMTQDRITFDQDNNGKLVCDDIATIAAKQNFKIDYLYPWQRLVIANILDAAKCIDQSQETDSISKQIVLLPTGAGKSLCFQIPALLLDGPTLVIYPLLALMSDQERRMQSGNLSCVVFKGGQTDLERKDNFKKIKEGAKIIIANPEVLSQTQLLEELSKIGISHIAIDEAHCVSEWGDSFRPAYLNLGEILKKINCKVVTAFTATASPEVLSRIAEVLFDGEAHIVRSESDRPNIHYYVRHVEAKKQNAIILANTEQRPMIIFCSSRSRTEDMSRDLNLVYGRETSRFYHAGLTREEKTKIEKWFFEKKDAVLCATCAYGMGVDKKDIKTVIHLDAPSTAESYIQEAGRGGRDGSIAKAILLWSTEDSIKTSSYSKNSRSSVMRQFALTKSCRRQVLLDALGAEQAVCSGCDICNDEKYENELNISKKMIKTYNKFYTKEELETKLIERLNKKSLPFTGVNIWTSQAFESIYTALLKERIIKILKWPWKDKIAVNGLRKRKRLTRIIHFYWIHHRQKLLRSFFRPLEQEQT